MFSVKFKSNHPEEINSNITIVIIVMFTSILHVVIINMFPDWTISWLQITSITVSSFMTLWTAANLYQLQLEEATIRELENEKKRRANEKSGAEW